MQNPILEAKSEISDIILSAMGRAVTGNELPMEAAPPFTVEVPADTKNGDFASNVAMASAKVFSMPPRKIAEIILANLALGETCIERAEIAGPGFINFFLRKDWFCNVVSSVLFLNNRYGRTDFGNGKSVVVEFVSANPTGPMHIGNARGGAIGDSLASVLEWSGHRVTREFYINDAGNQINKFGLSLEARYLQLFDDSFVFPEDAYLGDDIKEHAANFAELNGNKFVSCDEATRRKALVDFALPLNIKGLETDLARYRINYDVWFKESTIHNSGDVEKIINLFKEKGCTYQSEGALWFKASDFIKDAEDFVLLRSNGVPTYVVPDIAYHYNKLVTRNFDKAINILGADHHGYVPRLKASLAALDIDPNRLDAILMQMVRLVRDGETIKASKRSGKSITLVTLLDEVPIDAARFFFNMREANSQMDFDLGLAAEESSQNPVYYVQYAHARICSIIRNIVSDGVKQRSHDDCNLSLLSASEEIELIRHLAAFPNEIVNAAKNYDPARMTHYAVELATLFHKFYNACRVKCGEDELMQSRLALCDAVKIVLSNVLNLLKIDAPTSM